MCVMDAVQAIDDADAISQAKTLFTIRQPYFDPPLDGFELMDADRLVYRHSTDVER